MSDRIFSKWQLILPWIYVISGVYFLILMSSYLIDNNFHVCEWNDATGTLISEPIFEEPVPVNCPMIFAPYKAFISKRVELESPFNSEEKSGQLVLIVGILWRVTLAMYFISAFLLIKWSKQVKLLPNRDDYKKRIILFSILFCLAPVFIGSGYWATSHTNRWDKAQERFREQDPVQSNYIDE